MCISLNGSCYHFKARNCNNDYVCRSSNFKLPSPFSSCLLFLSQLVLFERYPTEKLETLVTLIRIFSLRVFNIFVLIFTFNDRVLLVCLWITKRNVVADLAKMIRTIPCVAFILARRCHCRSKSLWPLTLFNIEYQTYSLISDPQIKIAASS